MAAPKWEYLIERFSTSLVTYEHYMVDNDEHSRQERFKKEAKETDQSAEARINELGSQGWELVNVSVATQYVEGGRNGHNLICVFKRPK